MAPVALALREHPGLGLVLVHTGQHTDLAHTAYEAFGLVPDITLSLKPSPHPHLALPAMHGQVMQELSQALHAQRPGAVLVHGDTTSAAAAAMAAFYAKIPVGHVEAGLRTGDIYSPFPEEMNRSMIGRIAQWHYAPTSHAQNALLRENISEQNILMCGNTVIDAAQWMARELKTRQPSAWWQENMTEKRLSRRILAVTAHRRENWGEGLRSIANATADLLEQDSRLQIVWPLHANPAVAKVVRETFAERGLEGGDRLLLCSALGYEDMIRLLSACWLILTDSGGIQEEAAALRVPVLVARESTERPELIDAGGAVLVGTDRKHITQTVGRLKDRPYALERMRGAKNPFGAGDSGDRIVEHLGRQLRNAAATEALAAISAAPLAAAG